ncbi:MAG: hypothetical protein ACRYGG_23285 [Janthinobacterium lividum]
MATDALILEELVELESNPNLIQSLTFKTRLEIRKQSLLLAPGANNLEANTQIVLNAIPLAAEAQGIAIGQIFNVNGVGYNIDPTGQTIVLSSSLLDLLAIYGINAQAFIANLSTLVNSTLARLL